MLIRQNNEKKKKSNRNSPLKQKSFKRYKERFQNYGPELIQDR